MLLLPACTTPEAEAGTVALKYAQTIFVDASAGFALVCPADQAASSIAEQEAKTARIIEVLGKGSTDAEIATARLRTVADVVLSQAGKHATATLRVPDPQPAGVRSATFELDMAEAGWCVSTGWAEEKRIADLTSRALDASKRASALIAAWSFIEAEAAVAEEASIAAQLAEGSADRDAVDKNVALVRKLLDLKKKGWVGGRWSVTQTKDAMTDELNTVAMLEATTGLPDTVGELRTASLVVRCQRRALDVYITGDVMLDSEVLSDRISGQFRFDDEPAAKLLGSRGTNYKAIFLRGASGWLDSLQAHDGQNWSVELPLYGRGPATAVFDLTATKTALAQIPAECR